MGQKSRSYLQLALSHGLFSRTGLTMLTMRCSPQGNAIPPPRFSWFKSGSLRVGCGETESFFARQHGHLGLRLARGAHHALSHQ